jgi:hypothetical protein
MLEFYGTAQRGGNVELPHSTSLIGNSTSERMDFQRVGFNQMIHNNVFRTFNIQF